MKDSLSKTGLYKEGKFKRIFQRILPALILASNLLIPNVRLNDNVAFASVSNQYRAYIPLVSSPPAKPLSSFLGVNQGPGAGNNGGYFEGNLDNYYLLSNNMKMIKMAGIDRVRQYSSDNIIFSWNWNETSRGVYDWSKWDLFFDSARRAGLKVAPSIGNGVPSWASGSTDWKAIPTDLYNPLEDNSWGKYVEAFVRRYYSDLDMIEIWNEPDYMRGGVSAQFNGTVDDYIQMVKVAKQAIDKVDTEKKIKIIAPSSICAVGLNCSGSQKWSIEEFLLKAQNVLSNTYYVSFHLYSWEGGVMWDYTGYYNAVKRTNDLARDYGLRVLLNETAFRGSDENLKASSYVVFNVLTMGMSQFDGLYWYPYTESRNFTTPRSYRFSDVSSGTGSKGNEPDPYTYPIFTASEVFKDMLEDLSMENRPVKINTNSDVILYKYINNKGKEVYVYWLNSTTPTNFSLGTMGKRMLEVDLYGKYLGDYAGNLTATVMPKYLTSDTNWNSDRGKISGRVSTSVRSWDNGISTTLISAVNQGSRWFTTTTDFDGSYYFKNLPQGNYTVTLVLSNAGVISPTSSYLTLNNGDPFGRTSFNVIAP